MANWLGVTKPVDPSNPLHYYSTVRFSSVPPTLIFTHWTRPQANCFGSIRPSTKSWEVLIRRVEAEEPSLVGGYDYKLHCVDAATGKAVWTYKTGNYINGTPSLANGKAVFGGCDGLLHVVSVADGKQEKEIDAGAYVAGSVSLGGGRAYFGQFENEFLCIDLNDGKKIWTFRDRNFPYFSSPALTPDKVVFGGRDKLLHCVERTTGKPLWTFSTRGKVDQFTCHLRGQSRGRVGRWHRLHDFPE